MASQTKIELSKIISRAIKSGATQIHLEYGNKPIVRVDQQLESLRDFEVMRKEFLNDLSNLLLIEEQQHQLEQQKSVVTTKSFEGDIRYKIQIYYEKDKLAYIFTYIPATISEPQSIGLTDEFINLLKSKSGLILVSGFHGAGRTTTAISLLNHINKNFSKYILTLEKPVEYIITSQKSIIEQRQIGRDAKSFSQAIKFAIESDTDVVFISQIDSYETLKNIFSLVSSGRLVLAIVESGSAPECVQTLVNLAPQEETQKVRKALADNLLGIATQQLLPRRGGGQITVTEILISNSAVVSLINEGRYHQLTSVAQSSHAEGMRSLDQALLELVKTGEVDFDTALDVAVDKETFSTSAQRYRKI